MAALPDPDHPNYTSTIAALASTIQFHPAPTPHETILLPGLPTVRSFAMPGGDPSFISNSARSTFNFLRTIGQKIAIPLLVVLVVFQTAFSTLHNPLTRTPLLPILFAIPVLILVAGTLLVLAMLASTTPDLPYFFLRLDLRNLFPANPATTSTLGLPDFYQIGLFSFCSGRFPHPYPLRRGAQVEICSAPMYPFWPDPLHMIRDQLLSGAVIILPTEAQAVLDLVQKLAITNTNLYIASLVLFTLSFLSSLPAVAWGLFFHFRRRGGELRVHTSWPRAHRWSKLLFPAGMATAFLSSVLTLSAAILSTTIFWGGSEGLRHAATMVEAEVRGGVGGALGLVWGSVVGSWIVGWVWVWVGWRVWREEARRRQVDESAEQSVEGSRVGSVRGTVRGGKHQHLGTLGHGTVVEKGYTMED